MPDLMLTFQVVFRPGQRNTAAIGVTVLDASRDADDDNTGGQSP